MFNSCFSRQVNKKSSVIYENGERPLVQGSVPCAYLTVCTCKSLCDKYVLRHPLTACLLPPYRHTKTVPRADCSILITASLHLRENNKLQRKSKYLHKAGHAVEQKHKSETVPVKLQHTYLYTLER